MNRKYSKKLEVKNIVLDPNKIDLCKNFQVTYKGKDITGTILFCDMDLLVRLGSIDDSELLKEIIVDYDKEIKLREEKKHGKIQ